MRSVSEAGLTAPQRKIDSKDFLTISDTSVETFEQTTFASLSALDTLSLQSIDNDTLNPESYDNPPTTK